MLIKFIMQYENTIPKRKISENLFGPREGCVGPDYSASLSHLFLSLNHMHLELSFLASGFFIRSVGWIFAWLRCKLDANSGRVAKLV